MRRSPGRRLALGLILTAAPLSALSIWLLPSGWAIAGAAAAIAAASLYFGRELNERHAALLGVLRRLSEGDYSARAPRGDGGLGTGVNVLAERIGAAVAELSRDKSQLVAVLDQMTEAVVAVDASGVVLFVNPALSRLLSVDAAAARGRSYLESLRHKGVSEMIAGVLRERRVLAQEIRLFAREELVFDAHAAPLLQGERLAGALVVLHDISRLRRLEQVRRDFVANVGHELRTPLSSIKGFAETLREGALHDPVHAAEFLRTIEEHADRMSKLVDDLLDLSAIESGHRLPRFEAVDLASLCADVARQLHPRAEQAGVGLAVLPWDALPRVRADRDQLRQILVNLMDNAIKYNERQGLVEVSAEPWKDGVRVSVRDTGLGIPDADLPRVFERFYRVDKARSRDAGGTGLGLSIVKHLVEAHGGEISVESRQPGGSCFRFTLRAA
ncbi:MAG: PAS domain-containing protein [Elusimicrobia bacterium]|nr:PAS domain-containing protein [Elusimicrobiota bacterium]